MTDQEMLERAAAAANIDIGYFSIGYPSDGMIEWNPLKNDGDALRLAVKLRLDIEFLNGDVLVLNVAQGGGEPYADARCAIVRAAAKLAEPIYGN